MTGIYPAKPWRALMEAPLPTMIIAEDGEIQLINKEWMALSGYQPDEIPTIAVWMEKAYRECQG